MKIGVWENSENRRVAKFVGAVIFSRGANKSLGTPYGFEQIECCELTRVALTDHKTPVSRIVAIALRMLKQSSPGIRLVISFADPAHDHIGGIYQAGNWLFVGTSIPAEEYIVEGRRMHGRSMRAMFGSHIGKDFIEVVKGSAKYRYIMPLDEVAKLRVSKHSKPYPKRVKQAIVPCPGNSGGVAPTHTLQNPIEINHLEMAHG